MISASTNVVRLFPAAPALPSTTLRHDFATVDDLHALKDLAAELGAAKKAFLASAGTFDEASMALGGNAMLAAGPFFGQVEALEASIHALIGELTTHQPTSNTPESAS
jgi:hypothetical protein